MQRRDFIKLSSGVIAGVAAAGGSGIFSDGASTSAQAASHQARRGGKPPKITSEFRHRGKQVQIGERSTEDVVIVYEGRELHEHACKRLSSKKFSSHYLPFKDFKSARQLAEALVEENGRLFVL